MAFSTLAQTIDDVIMARENELVHKIAAKFNIDETALRAEFNLGQVEVKVKKQYKKRTAKEVTVTNEEGQVVKEARKECSATTAKKEPCKFAALKGCDFCKRHQKAHEKEENPQQNAAPKTVKQPESAPIHSHSPDGETHVECELCQIQGPPDVENLEYAECHLEPEDEDPFAASD